MNKSVMITGINGLLGQNIVREFSRDHDIYGLDLTPGIFGSSSNIKVKQLDLNDVKALDDYVELVRPDSIIHTAAYTNVDRAEEDEDIAFAVNGLVPASIAQIGKKFDIPLVHISTDYVFSGDSGPYKETDTRDARGKYSESKLAGERAVLESGAEVAVIRPNVMYGHGKNLKSSFVEWLLTELRNERSVRIVDDQYNNPTYARRLAAVIRVVLDQKAWDIWHFGSKEVVSRYTFALKIADTFGLSSALINAISTVDLNQKAPRPMRSGLICEKLKKELTIPIMSIDEELALLKEEMHVS
ncbi:MAG: dTDP-4-dehydrorhamnose reductase [Candidatus Marinimicrobia bacterium]|nr:dTDP-4-dehydrorhamnose reductase [Candidatus Neomarinimicrobiota bacterium]MBT4360672.1 dTDP-4-dehydrorhamnose reductase [Candidatus Neomarinimicrobiota bacterium]MBT4715502.1 dTDP-4-dehydrorhamnose reductase [Candidatus Neomarinimicrobiota bacterium]MBT5270722.1 dTDP-4-dehydrorhamnose reductase [Candidatus Neomarinimicrobiota bacterium]MBT6011576.1 dTDP-4-dehydrorhamnose reductase [Candidatus Neomarinimicrobiota bacterium]